MNSKINENKLNENDPVSILKESFIRKEYTDDFWKDDYIPNVTYFENGVHQRKFLPLTWLENRLMWLKSYVKFVEIRKSGIDNKETQIHLAKQVPIVSLYESSHHKKGKYVIDNCPLHNEKTPSFFVDIEKNTFRCFGCGEYGDVIDFVIKKNGLKFKEALKFLNQ